MEIKELYKYFFQCNRVNTDSRKVEKNDLFFALKGEKFDGNEYAAAALEKGSAFAVVDNEQFAMNNCCLLVKNGLEALQQLAAYHIQQLKIPVIAITGSNGKTTTKELIQAVLSKKYRAISTRGNLNNHIGVPLTVLSFDKDTETGIVEMGANHVREIAGLCKIAQPTHGIITNVGKAHLEGFGSFEGVKKAKGELYDYLKKVGGKVVYNLDNQHLTGMLGANQKNGFTYGTKNGILRGRIVGKGDFLAVEVLNQSGRYIINTKLVGYYNLENVLAAFAFGVLFDVDCQDIVEAIEAYSPANNRSQLLKTEKNTLVLDYYNANPTSMQMAISNFAGIDHTKKVVILGDMLELGALELEEHKKVVDLLETYGFDEVFLVGTAFGEAAANSGLKTFINVQLLIEYLEQNHIAEAAVLIKGSRGIHLEETVSYL
jgi:UDP-N-acetylmuramoyl-tripeptide--D-alanyl-D-alanine ligase